MSNELTIANQNLIKQANQLSGMGSQQFPSIPTIKVNNKKEKKIANIDGKETEVEVLPEASFIITRRNEETGEYEKLKFSDAPLEGVVLTVRYRIQEKFDVSNPRKKLFFSHEFNLFQFNIKVFDGTSKKVIAEGTYPELKDKLSSGLTDSGLPKKTFDLIMYIYFDLNASGEVYRLERSVTANDEWYGYCKKFRGDDTFVRYLTKFNLQKERTGSNEFWKLFFEKSSEINLEPELNLQKELDSFFKMKEGIKSNNQESVKKEESIPVIQVEEREVTDQDIQSIPF